MMVTGNPTNTYRVYGVEMDDRGRIVQRFPEEFIEATTSFAARNDYSKRHQLHVTDVIAIRVEYDT